MSKTDWLRLEPPPSSINPQIFVRAKSLLSSLQLQLKYKGSGTVIIGSAQAKIPLQGEFLLNWEVSFDSRSEKFAFAAAQEETVGKSKLKSKQWRVENEVCYVSQNGEESEVPAPPENWGRVYLPVQALFYLLGHTYSSGQQGRILLLLGTKYYQVDLSFELEDRIDLKVSSLVGHHEYTGSLQFTAGRSQVAWIAAKVPVLGSMQANQVLN